MTTGRINQVARPACIEHDDSVSPRRGRAGLHRRMAATSSSHLSVSPPVPGRQTVLAAGPLPARPTPGSPGIRWRRSLVRRPLAPRQRRSGGALAIAGRSRSPDGPDRASCSLHAQLGGPPRCFSPSRCRRSCTTTARRTLSRLATATADVASPGGGRGDIQPGSLGTSIHSQLPVRGLRRKLAALPRGAHRLTGMQRSTPLLACH